MADRKPLSKKIRFEVFKRDKFTCQYCGRMAPDVVLQVDHIKPVSKGGKNDILNLVTSCADCNNGKSNIELSDDSIVKKQQKQLFEIAERKEQLEMMLKWRSSMDELEEMQAKAVADYFAKETGFGISKIGIRKVKKWINEFSIIEVLDATRIAIARYFDGSAEGALYAFDRISGICFNRRKQSKVR